ncbi:hypothetical protein IT084_06690 [Desulfallas sp. Bu1-1]|uniref:CAP domain-containing protein n=1 Tax=Desulfallas sp. Bu1-1 TaxID=2787620 RepID=UPI00189CA7F6|nr:CAP domain-containing protein [Desulfallas sp. Bu1-1]MBF7082663.1 hypothetical protein [Desulfallas sp. Bu1-1]
MQLRTKWLGLIPVLVVLLASMLVTGLALASDTGSPAGGGPVLQEGGLQAGEMVPAGEAMPEPVDGSGAGALLDPGRQPVEQPAEALENSAEAGAAGEAQAAPVPQGEVATGVPVAVAGLEKVRLTAEEAGLLELVNGERRQAGVDVLEVDNMLTVMARLKGRDLAARGYLTHRSSTYGTMEDMLNEAGVVYREVQENLARSRDAASAHNRMMRNAILKARILDPRFDRVGVAVVKDNNGYCYVVEVFVDLGGGAREDDETPAVDNNSDTGDNRSPGYDPRPEPQPVSGMTADEREMLELVNRERVQRGLKPLQLDASLTQLARLKARDMVDKNYFGHNSPTYGSPFDMMRSAGIRYVYAGENLAMAPSVSRAHSALMNSPGHRANILNGNFDRVGIGIVAGGYSKYFVQMFAGGQQNTNPVPAPRPAPGPDSNPEPDPRSQPDPGSDSGVNNLTPDEREMFQLVNQERLKAGVRPLTINYNLVKLARLKAQDMIKNGYFSHTSPTYGSPFDMMRRFGISYSYAGENLAGAPGVRMAHVNLMNSSGHRRNILNSNFTEVGIGVVDGGPYGKMFVQMFIRS